MAIEIRAKKNIKAPAWSIILFVLSVILIGVGVLHYFYLSSRLDEFTGKLTISPQERALASGILAKEREIKLINSKADIFGRLIIDHKDIVKIFEFFEKFSLKNVWFSNFSFSNSEAVVFGNADNFVTLERQILLFKKQPAVNNVSILGAKIGKEGGIDFSLAVNFNSQIFKVKLNNE